MTPDEAPRDPTDADLGRDGLLGSFANALAGVGEHDEATPPTGRATPIADESERVRPIEEAVDPSTSPWAPAHGPDAAPRRPIDADARRIAERLLHGRSASTGRFRLVDADSGAAVAFDREIAIGRGPRDDATTKQFVSDLAVVSRHHCDVRHDGSGLVVSDAGSANGTFVLRDGATIEVGATPVALRHGDLIATARGERPIARFERNDEDRA